MKFLRAFTHYPFALVVLLISLIGIISLGHHWIVVHDTLNAFFVGYSFFNTLVTDGVLGFWAPYLNWGQSINLNLMANNSPIFLALGPLVKFFPKMNLMTLYYVSLLFEDLFLGIGTYLLTSRFYKTTFTRIFITICMVGTSLWMIEIFFNFRLYYALPLILYYLIKGIDEERPTYLLLGASVLFLTGAWGSALYMSVFQGLFVGVFIFFYLLYHPLSIKKVFKNFKLQDFALLVAFVTLVTASILFLVGPGMPSLISPGRSADGNLDYLDFLNFNKDHFAVSMNGLFFGFREHKDATIFSGLLTLPFLLYTLVHRPVKIILPFAGAAGFTFLFYMSEESMVAPMLYFAPVINLVRHGYLLTPYLKFSFLFVAGFGIDFLASQYRLKSASVQHCCKFVSTTVLVLFIGFLAEWKTLNRDTRTFLLMALFVGLIIAFKWFSRGSTKMRLNALKLILFLVFIDVVNYKVGYLHSILIPVTDEEWDLFKPRKLAFQENREFENKYSYMLPRVGNHRQYTVLSLFEQFLGTDICVSPLRGDTVSPAVKDLYLYYKYRLSEDPMLNTDLGKIIGCSYPKFQLFKDIKEIEGLAYHEKNDPYLRHWESDNVPTAKRFDYSEGLSNTFRFFMQGSRGWDLFSQLYRSFDGNIKIARGDLPNTLSEFRYMEDPKIQKTRESIPKYLKEIKPLKKTLDVKFQIFSTLVQPEIKLADYKNNKLEFSIKAPAKEKIYWLYMSEPWHKRWSATVNDAPARIENVNFGFRAVQIPGGESKIVLKYDQGNDTKLFWLLWCFFATFLAVTLGTAVKFISKKDPIFTK